MAKCSLEQQILCKNTEVHDTLFKQQYDRITIMSSSETKQKKYNYQQQQQEIFLTSSRVLFLIYRHFFAALQD